MYFTVTMNNSTEHITSLTDSRIKSIYKKNWQDSGIRHIIKTEFQCNYFKIISTKSRIQFTIVEDFFLPDCLVWSVPSFNKALFEQVSEFCLTCCILFELWTVQQICLFSNISEVKENIFIVLSQAVGISADHCHCTCRQCWFLL